MIKIKDAIKILNEYASESEHGEDTELDFDLHIIEWTANLKRIPLKFEDLTIAYYTADYGGTKVIFDLSISEANINELTKLTNEYKRYYHYED